MKRRTFISRALGAIGLGAVAGAADLKMAEATETLPLLGTAKNPRQISAKQGLKIDPCASTEAREMLKRILEQEPDKDGVRRTRWAVVRNTQKECVSALGALCQESCALYETGTSALEECGIGYHYASRNKSRFSFVLIDDTRVEAEVLFLFPPCAKQLLSLELTGAWICPYGYVEGKDCSSARSLLTNSVGRYPSRFTHGIGPTWDGFIGERDDLWIPTVLKRRREKAFAKMSLKGLP